jgi:phage-related minor tail protein
MLTSISAAEAFAFHAICSGRGGMAQIVKSMAIKDGINDFTASLGLLNNGVSQEIRKRLTRFACSTKNCVSSNQ